MENKEKLNLKLILKIILFAVGIGLLLASIIVVAINFNSEFHLKMGTAFLVVGIAFTVVALTIKTIDDKKEEE